MTKAVTLADPVSYFRMLDAASHAHWWGRSIEYVERRWLKSALRTLRSRHKPPWDWLDVGCGTGARLRLWNGWGCWNLRAGIEPEAEAVSIASTDASILVRTGELPELPFDDLKFAVITALDVIQHVSPELRRNSIRAMAERLVPEGIMVVRTNSTGLFRKNSDDSTIVDANDLKSWLAESGMRVVRASRFNACGGLADDLIRKFQGGKRISRTDPFKTGLPKTWSMRPGGHFLARWAGFVESRILGTGLVNFPFGHSYLVMAIREGDHDRSTNR
jgi:SAM-dependent methyltransferase